MAYSKEWRTEMPDGTIVTRSKAPRPSQILSERSMTHGKK